MWDDEAGYDRGDPKHPDYAEAMRGRADDDRKRAREEGSDWPALRAEVLSNPEVAAEYERIKRREAAPVEQDSAGVEFRILQMDDLQEGDRIAEGWRPWLVVERVEVEPQRARMHFVGGHTGGWCEPDSRVSVVVRDPADEPYESFVAGEGANLDAPHEGEEQ